jgi:hypothetical protein
MKTRIEELHGRVVAWGQKRAGLEEQECQLLRAVEREKVHDHLGMGFTEYVERFIGLSPRETRERLRVARLLVGLPATAAAFREAEIGWSVARELTRVLIPATERVWLKAVKGKVASEVEEMVAGRSLGDLPTDPQDEKKVRHVLRVELSAESMATFREAIAKLRKDGLDEDSAYLEMARAVLAPSDTGKSSYQLTVNQCQDCGRAQQLADGKMVPVEAAVLEAACCDGNDISGGRARQSVTPAVRRQIFARDNHRCTVPGCQNRRYLDIHHLVPQDEFGISEPKNLILLCGAHHRAEHLGRLLIKKTQLGRLEFRHADGSPYGSPSSLSATIAYAKAFQELRERGVPETRAHEALQATT